MPLPSHFPCQPTSLHQLSPQPINLGVQFLQRPRGVDDMGSHRKALSSAGLGSHSITYLLFR